MDRKRILIVGGVAGGASCAARARRLDENAEIIIFERGPHISYALCGLPYYIGGVIRQDASLLAASPELFRTQFNIEVRTEHEVTAIDRAARSIAVRNLRSGEEYRERYDALVLSPGASPVRPALPGVDLPGIFTLRTIPDGGQVRQWIERTQAKRAVIVGAGYIGLEMAENLSALGLKVTILEMTDQVLPPLDREMAGYAQAHLMSRGVDVRTCTAAAGFQAHPDGGLLVQTQPGARLRAHLVILSTGVRPETQLAAAAGLAIGECGGIRVDARMQTSDPAIWAAGDAVEVQDPVTGEWRLTPLAGPANRQGRIAADAICGRDTRYRGTQGTAVCGFFGFTAAVTGATEKTLCRVGFRDYAAVYLHPMQHAEYYPGAARLCLKLIFRKPDGLILGAQATGEHGVAKRIDVLAMAIQKQATVYDLEEAELGYAPQYGSAKDPVNMAGMIAANVLRGDVQLAPWEELPGTDALVLDVREPLEYASDHLDNAVNIPLDELRQRLSELPADREIWVNCAVGQRAYYALRLLVQHGFRVRNLSGGYRTWQAYYPDGTPEAAGAE